MDFAMLFLKSAKVTIYSYETNLKITKDVQRTILLIDKLREKVFKHHNSHPHFFNIFSL